MSIGPDHDPLSFRVDPLSVDRPIASRSVVSKQEMNKRRVSAQRTQQRRQHTVVRKDRRKRLILGSVVGFLAVAMMAPLAAGLLLTGSDSDPTTTQPIDTLPTTTTPPSLVDPDFAGAALTGSTPCPVVDGSQVRTTQFETAPPLCIDPGVAYDIAITLGDDLGPIAITIDSESAPEAANMFVTLANYRTYESTVVTPVFPGLTIIGGDGNAGFTIAATELPADGAYPIGSVVMFTSIDGSLEGQIGLVTSEEAGDLLAENPVHPIIGEITGALDAAIALHEASIEDLSIALRVSALTVAEVP